MDKNLDRLRCVILSESLGGIFGCKHTQSKNHDICILILRAKVSNWLQQISLYFFTNY